MVASTFADMAVDAIHEGKQNLMTAVSGGCFALQPIPDPALAASQFNALITGELSARTGLGTRPIGDTDLDRLVAAGVDTFLRAFRARPAPNGGPSGVANRPA